MDVIWEKNKLKIKENNKGKGRVELAWHECDTMKK